MKKIILCILFCLSTIHSNSLYKDVFISLRKTADFDIFITNSSVVEKNGTFYLQLTYSFEYNNQFSSMKIYFILKDGVDIDSLLELTNSDTCKYDPSPFGMGSILSYSEEKGYTPINNNATRFAAIWGSFVSRDILIYRSMNEGVFYSEYMVEFINIWPNDIEIPKNFNNKMLEDLINKSDPVSQRYIFLDDLISNGLTINEIK